MRHVWPYCGCTPSAGRRRATKACLNPSSCRRSHSSLRGRASTSCPRIGPRHGRVTVGGERSGCRISSRGCEHGERSASALWGTAHTSRSCAAPTSKTARLPSFRSDMLVPTRGGHCAVWVQRCVRTPHRPRSGACRLVPDEEC
eukprot:3909452-Prymnesium_polylepis.2